jgi:uncharacterized protein YjbI with pentapeptide repeats
LAKEEDVQKLRAIPKDPKYTWARTELQRLDLTGADLRGIDLKQVHLMNCDFSGANLDGVILAYSQFFHCKFTGASLNEAYLGYSTYIGTTFDQASLQMADLVMGRYSGTVFTRADLRKVNGVWANFRSSQFDEADLRGMNLQDSEAPLVSFRSANLNDLELMHTVLSGADFTGALGLDQVKHNGPSLIDFAAVQRSGGLPLSFLRGCGLPDEVIEFYEAYGGAIHFNSCFISHADKDRDFADRLTADLQSAGVRCWYSPVHLKIGDRQRETLSEAIHFQDKLLVILSQNALSSDWVESEVELALEHERKEKRRIIFPIRLDNDVLDSRTAWAQEVRRVHIGDFRKWRDHDAYRIALERLLRDLKADT